MESNYIAVATVNGLIATAVIWIFWTPFMIVVASPVINAMIKDFLCSHTYLIKPFIYAEFGPEALEIYASNLPNPPTVATNIVNENRQEYINDNYQIFAFFICTSIAVIVGSIYLANGIIQTYNLDSQSIIGFNIPMAIIIMIIETAFFISVAVQFNPFDAHSIFGALKTKIDSELVPLVGKQSN
jgi:hypothetical protein